MYETRTRTDWATRAVWESGSVEIWPVDDEATARQRAEWHKLNNSSVPVMVVKREVITLTGEWTEA